MSEKSDRQGLESEYPEKDLLRDKKNPGHQYRGSSKSFLLPSKKLMGLSAAQPAKVFRKEDTKPVQVGYL